MSYEQQIQIDRDDLDTELVRQPSLFLEVSQKYVQAVSVRDAAKENVDVARAKVELKIRRRAEEQERKLTESTVKAEVEVHSMYREAVDAYLQAKERADRWLATKEAFSQRAFILKDLCGLYVSGYYTTESVRGKSQSQVQELAYTENRKEMSRKRAQP